MTIIAGSFKGIAERFLPIPGYEGMYEISDLGKVRSIDRVVKARKGKDTYQRMSYGKIIQPFFTNYGYLSVKLNKDGQRTAHRINRLVLNAFVGPRPDMASNHINAIPTDNRLCNLEWVTLKGNRMHFINNFRTVERMGCFHKLSVDQVKEIISLRKSTRMTILQIADRYGVSRSQVQRIVTGAQWQQIIAMSEAS